MLSTAFMAAVCAIAALAFTALAVMTLAGVARQRVNLVPTALSGFTETGTRAFRAVAGPDDQHIVAFAVPLVSGRDHAVTFRVERTVGFTGPVSVDLMAPGYDDPAQERALPLSTLRPGRDVTVTLNAGAAPSIALLRIFYRGPPGLEVSQLKLELLPVGLVPAVLVSALAFVTSAYGLGRRSGLRTRVAEQWRKLRDARVDAAPVIILYAASTVVHYFVYLLTPYWSGDEFWYKSLGLAIWEDGGSGSLSPDAIGDNVSFPNLLYPYFISPTFALGENFYAAVRLLNAAAMGSAIFPVYFLAREHVRRRTALCLAGFAIWFPSMALGVYAVTEALFYPLFAWSALVAIRALEDPNHEGLATSVGVLAGILVHLRPNGFLPLVAYEFAFVLLAYLAGNVRTVLARPTWLLALLGFVCAYLFGVAALGAPGATGIGRYETVFADHQGASSLVTHTAAVLELVVGHAGTLAVPYALPIGIVLAAWPRRRALATGERKLASLLSFSGVSFLVEVAVAIALTIKVAPIDLGGVGRLHARYYFATLPLVMVSAAALYPRAGHRERAVGAAVALLLIAAHVYYVRIGDALANPRFGSLVDNMEIQWIRHFPRLYWWVIASYILLVFVYLRAPRRLSTVLAAALAVHLVLVNWGTAREARVGPQAANTECGHLAAEFLRMTPGTYAVVADSRAAKVAVILWMPATPARSYSVPSDGPGLDLSSVLETADYVVVNGEPKVLHHGVELKVATGRCRIFGKSG